MSKRRKRETKPDPEWIEQKRKEQHEMLERGVQALMNTDGWIQWMKTRSKFRTYSLNNQLLIAIQCPTATMVAGFRKWQSMGRQVRKGEKAIRIFAPIKKKFDVVDGDTHETEEKWKIVNFKLAAVFDVAQTDGDTLPEYPEQPLTGDSHADLLPKLEAHAYSLGFTVSYEDTGHPDRGGFCNATTKQIVVRHDLPANGQVRVLVHEIAHARGIGYKDFGRQDAEVLVESVTFLVCNSLGLDTGGTSFAYLAGWSTGDLKALKEFVGTVNDVALHIEDACELPKNNPAAEKVSA